MSKLLFESAPLVVNTELAKLIGLNEAIILQQVNYWCNINREKKINYKDGHYWTFNTFNQWQEQFPFWSLSTIKRIISSLENRGLLISGNYNKKGFDRTKWYRIPDNIKEMIGSEWNNPLVQNEPMESIKMNQPIPEINKEIKNRLNENARKMVFFKEKNTLLSAYEKHVKTFIDNYMNNLYFEKTGKKHPALKKEQYNTVLNTLTSFAEENCLDDEALEYLAIGFLNSNICTDYNINHFATEGILQNRFYELLY